jgi:hypothetical protein
MIEYQDATSVWGTLPVNITPVRPDRSASA